MQNKQNLLIRLTCFVWIFTKIYGYKVWIAEGRLYPAVPVFEFLDAVPLVVHTVLYGISLLGLALVFIFPQKRNSAIFTLCIILSCCMLDILRWQPWEYQFLFFLIIFIINKNKPEAFYNAIVFVLASVYVYSGIHKVNGGFLIFVWEQMILKFLHVPKATIVAYKLHYMGLLMPVTEIAMGLSLLFIKKKIIPLLLLVTMHLFILAMLVTGFDFAIISTVPQWNIFMMLFLFLYYYKEQYTFSFPVIWKGRNKVVVLFWGILPALCFVGYWDDFLSSSLYSGNLTLLNICLKDTTQAKELHPFFSNNELKFCEGNKRLGAYKWAFDETTVLPYPEQWYFKKFKVQFEKKFPGVEATFIVSKYPFTKRVTIEKDTCIVSYYTYPKK